MDEEDPTLGLKVSPFAEAAPTEKADPTEGLKITPFEPTAKRKSAVPTVAAGTVTAPAKEAGPANWAEVPMGASAGDVLTGAVKNIIPSTGRAALGVYEAVRHPGETWNALKQVGLGVDSKIERAAGRPGNLEAEKVVDALMASYGDRYGSLEKIAHTLANDPAGLLMDTSAVLGAPELAVGRAGLGIGKAAKAVGAVGRAINPLDPLGAISGGVSAAGTALAGRGRGLDAAITSATKGKITAADLAALPPERAKVIAGAFQAGAGPEEAIMRGVGHEVPRSVITGKPPALDAAPAVGAALERNQAATGARMAEIAGADRPSPTSLAASLEQAQAAAHNRFQTAYNALSATPGEFHPQMASTAGAEIAKSLQGMGFLNPKAAVAQRLSVWPHIPSVADLGLVRKQISLNQDLSQSSKALQLIQRQLTPGGAPLGGGLTFQNLERTRQQLNSLLTNAEGSDRAAMRAIIDGYDANIQQAIPTHFTVNGAAAPADVVRAASDNMLAARNGYKSYLDTFLNSQNAKGARKDIADAVKQILPDQTKDAGTRLISGFAGDTKHEAAQNALGRRLLDPAKGADLHRELVNVMGGPGSVGGRAVNDFVRQSVLSTDRGVLTRSVDDLDRILSAPGGVAKRVFTPEELAELKLHNFSRYQMAKKPARGAQTKSLTDDLSARAMRAITAGVAGHGAYGIPGAVGAVVAERVLENLWHRARVGRELRSPSERGLPAAAAAALARGAVSPRARLLAAETTAGREKVGEPQPSAAVDRILGTIKARESRGSYTARNPDPRFTASGAYQFTDATWNDVTRRHGIGIEYRHAADAPPQVQDAVARKHVEDILARTGGDVSKVPLVWYTGNAEGRMSPEHLALNQGQTPAAYQQAWLRDYTGRPSADGGRIERASGGRIGMDHGQRAEALIRAAEAARKQEGQATKPLLNLPDETITRALSIANRSI